MANTEHMGTVGSRAENRERWRRHVARQQRGQLTQREYCETYDLTYSSFTRWRALLRSSASVAETGEMSAFVPVKIQATRLKAQTPNEASVSLVLPSGIQITGITSASAAAAVAVVHAL